MVRPFKTHGEIPQPSPYRPAHFKYLNSFRAKEAIKEAILKEADSRKDEGGANRPVITSDDESDSPQALGSQRRSSLKYQKELNPLPNFQKALFSTNLKPHPGRLAHKNQDAKDALTTAK